MVSAVKCNKNSTITYGYNDRSEVTSADATSNANYDFGFSYDPIGNRLTSASKETGSTVSRNYTSNLLNQYTAINNPTQGPTYNDDGCMLGDGTWAFTWDVENRLVTAIKTNDTKLEFKYDYMSRRVEKKVYSWDSDSWLLTSDFRFVYDGYLQIEELDGANSDAILKTRVWSPALQGLGSEKYLSETQGETTYYALGDANKNVTEYLDASGNIKAHYEFSPFGKVVTATGAMSGDFNYRFSSEYLDIETGLVYYNHRYYSPEIGKWLSRDPIEEFGGCNLYGTGNDFLNKNDYRGLWMSGDHNTFTATAFDSVTAGGNYDPDALGGISKIIQESNTNVDDEFFNNPEYHFNRDPGDDIDSRRQDYSKNLDKLLERFNGALNNKDNNGNPSCDECKDALKRLGELSHAWQDYYAHAIAPNSNGNIYSIGNIQGDPSHTENMKPSSFVLLWSFWSQLQFLGEHGVGEPGSRAPDSASRRQKSAEFTADKYKKLLMDEWWPKCYCKCCGEWKNGK